MTPLVVENEPPVTFLRRKMTGGRFSMGVVIRRYTCFTPQTKEIRKYQIARYNCIQYSTPKTLIFETKCHSVADLRERSPPPPPRGGSGRFPVKKRDKFL